MAKPLLDTTNLKILDMLRRNPDSTAADLGRVVGLTPSAANKRVRRLRRAGVLVTRICGERLFPVRALVAITVDLPRLHSENLGFHDQHQFAEFILSRLQADPNFRPLGGAITVESVSIILGAHADLLVIVAAKDNEALVSFVTTVVRYWPGVAKTDTNSLITIQEAHERTPHGLARKNGKPRTSKRRQ